MHQSQRDYLQNILLPLRASRQLFICIMALHLLALLSLFYFALTIPKWPVYVFIISSALSHSRCHTLNTMPLGAVLLRLDADDQWTLYTAHGDSLQLTLLGTSFVHPRIVILGFQCKRRRIYFRFLTDNIDENSFRRLRIRLRFPLRAPGDP